VAVPTAKVMIGNEAEIEPVGTVTVAGVTAAAGLLLERLITRPPGPAGPARMI
jgi:hypothetical protein